MAKSCDEFIFNIEGMTMSSSSERDSGFSEGLGEEEEVGRDFANPQGLSLDLRFLAGMPELCDVMFLVGEEREPVYAVKAVLAIRSRVFYKMLFGPRSRGRSSPPSSSSNQGGVSKKIHKIFAENSPIRASRRPSVVQNAAGGVTSERQTVAIEEFEPDVFKELLEFIHTGSVVLHPRTLLGLMNAADHFAIEDLRRACVDYSSNCIKLETVCSLLVTAEKYIQYKSTKIFIQRVLEFVDNNGEEVLRLGEIVHLPRHVLELILSREDLVADDTTKWRGVERWARHYILYHPREQLSALMRPFVQYIAFQNIPTATLMQEIKPLNIVPDDILMNALAVQADPDSVHDSINFLDDDTSAPWKTPVRGRNRNSVAAIRTPSQWSLAKSKQTRNSTTNIHSIHNNHSNNLRNRHQMNSYQSNSNHQQSAMISPAPVPRSRKSLINRHASLDRNTSKRSTGSSGYDSLGFHEEENGRGGGYESRGKTVLLIEDPPLPLSSPPLPPRTSSSITDLSYRSVYPVEYTRM